MAKGKKKGGGKATSSVEASVSALSIADSGASTSQAPEEEDCGGLTGGASKKKPQKVVEKPVEEKKDDKPPEAAAAPDPPKEAPKEEEFEGLGLTGGAKKSRNRKKKPAQAAQPPPVGQPGPPPVGQPGPPPVGQPGPPPVGQPGPPPVGQPGSLPGQPTQQIPSGGPPGFPGLAGPTRPKASNASTSQAPEEEDCGGLTGGASKKKPQKVVEKPVEEKKDDKPPEAAAAPDPPKEAPKEEEFEGLGLTGGAKKSRNRKKKPAQAAQPPPVGQPGPPPVGQPGPPPVGQPGPPPVGQPGPPPVGQPGPPPVGQPGGLPGQPTQQIPSGGPPGFPGLAGPTRPKAMPTQGAPFGTQPPPGQRPQPGASGDRQAKYEPLPMSKQQQMCQFTIPGKILGRSVPSRRVNVITNYLPMTIKPLKVNRYDISFTPDRPRKMIPAAYKMLKDKLFPNEIVAFDSFKNAYCLNALKKNVVDVTHTVDFPDPNGRIIQFKVTFKHTGIVDFSKIIRHMETQGSSLAVPMEEVQCMDVVLRQGTLESYVKCGRNFFKRPDRPLDLSGGLEMWTGLFQSAIFTSRPFINVDVAHKGFPIHQSMLDAYKSMGLDLARGIEQQMGRSAETFKDFVKGIRVVCKLVGGTSDGQTREFVVNSVKERPTALQFTKEREGGKSVTVYDYYLREKGYKIKYPHLPCLWVGARDRSIYYPIELCTVSYGQALRRQLNEFQLATMVREAATPPDERKRKIEEVAKHMNYNQNVLFKKFGLEISNQFLEVEAKVLQPPSLNCGEGRATFPSRGAWNSSKLLKPEALVSWGFIGVELQPQACNFEQISSLLCQTGGQLGMQVSQAKMSAFNVAITELRALFFKAQERGIHLLFIIVPMRGKDYYHRVKQFAENDVGILTQCIKEQTATRRMNHQTIKNILLKVNSKLMGINQCLDNTSVPRCITSGNVMIVGADVTHPSPEQQNIPSIAAVTASMDPKCFVYHIELSIQSPKVEMISQFEDMMYDHLKMYVQRNGRPPKKIYVFRDGVSEGQFGAVMNQELRGLLQAYARFTKEKPEVLFLLVQKRHHTRLFGSDSRTRKIINVEPGTVVDTHIVHPKELDFYLVSHAAIKGTARPTRYHSVCNDGGIPHDEVEQLTFYLCHLYSRCMRSVSYPTPTYYAHLACLRARSLTHGATFNNADLEKNPRRLRVLDKMLRSSLMFFV